MIDTDKYEGHTEGLFTDGNKDDAQLIADAPLLLAEVKRLRAYKEFADGVEEWSGGAAFIHHLATAVQGIRRTGELDEDAFNKGCQEYYNGENSIAQVSMNQWNDLREELKRLRGLLNMIADKALHEVNTQPNGDDSPYNIILNIAYEGVIE